MLSQDARGERLFLGLDIGSVNARIAIVNARGQVIRLDSERIYRGSAPAVEALLDRLGAALPSAAIIQAGVCGSGRHLFADRPGWQVYSSPYAAIVGCLGYDLPETGVSSTSQTVASPRTIIQIGGQSAFVIALEGGLGQPWRVARSPLCAAGTGRFLEQQAHRLDIPIEEFGPLALEWTQAPPRIAARCSVFAKSDLIHLQQKGWPVSAMLSGLSDSVARMIRAQWREPFLPPVYFVGGVAANTGVVRALAEALGLGHGLNGAIPAAADSVGRLIVPAEASSRESIGAALLAAGVLRGFAPQPVDADAELAGAPNQNGHARIDLYPPIGQESEVYQVARRLTPPDNAAGWLPADLAAEAARLGRPVDVYLGVDVGSTSTKAAVIDPSGRVLAKNYLMTAGQPLEAVKQVMANLAPELEGNVRVIATGVTGSGRYLVGSFIGADLIKNEITAQTRAALQIDPAIDTVFELGGQDSKYVYLENGTALDYQMNKACAAGTGSFVDELAEQLGISTRTGQFAELAFAAETQLDLGERCAAFMSQAVTSAQHAEVPIEVIVSSLSTSLAKNYRSKVIGTNRVGQRIFLTGAVFYNQAAVAAFQAEFPGKTFIVPEHKEVTGAIGAALLAGEAVTSANKMAGLASPTGTTSGFRGFAAVAEATYTLRNFNCRHCENSCAISMMTLTSGEKLYYGSRCDRYDAIGRPAAARDSESEVADSASSDTEGARGLLETPFNEREALLFSSYRPASADPLSAKPRITVGVPRALMAYDFAPMLTSFLNELGVTVRYSPPTNKRIIEKSLEHAYTDSCFPIKLLHGHVAALLEEGDASGSSNGRSKSTPVDWILIPNAIRLDRKSGEEDQRYACPLVQAAPYIVSSVFGLRGRLLDPIIDLSRGDEKTIESFAEVAGRLGFTREQGLAAGRVALASQREYTARARIAGQQLLDRIAADPTALGVVLLSRAYNAQDAGANLGMAQELAKLGVIPIPLDFLPLDDVDVMTISDRPYWSYERKLLAGAKIVAENRQLFGLFLSNFGCGPNSIIQNIVEDIMGGKPLGQIEIDEHAAEAGYITRLEALIDTIRGYYQADRRNLSDPAKYVRRVPTVVKSGQNVLVARMADHATVVAAAMRAFGVNAEVLPESDERSMALSRDVTSGKECLPFRDTLGVFLRMGEDDAIPAGARALMAGSYGPCRLGKYAQEQQKILDERGIGLTVMTTVSNKAYADLGLGSSFELLAWQGVLATDYLNRLLWMTRPYERRAGECDRIYRAALSLLAEATQARKPVAGLMREATASFLEQRDPTKPPRPLVGINGEIYLRANRFCNKDLVGLCEANGLEVEVSPLAEWFRYTAFRAVEDAVGNRDIGQIVKSGLRRLVLEHYDGQAAGWVKQALADPEPGPEELLGASGKYLPSRNGSEAVLSLGAGALQLASPRYAGVISVMPHGCMPGGIVAAIAEQVSREHGHKPWISLTYDGFADKVNPERVADLAEQVKHH